MLTWQMIGCLGVQDPGYEVVPRVYWCWFCKTTLNKNAFTLKNSIRAYETSTNKRASSEAKAIKFPRDTKGGIFLFYKNLAVFDLSKNVEANIC